MERGKQVCKILKDIRKQIAEENDIEFITSECQHKGDCAGTCPKCEAELRYLESQLARRSAAGFPARLAGIALGLAAVAPTLTSCDELDIIFFGDLFSDILQDLTYLFATFHIDYLFISVLYSNLSNLVNPISDNMFSLLFLSSSVLNPGIRGILIRHLSAKPAAAMNLRFSRVLMLSTPVYALYICGFISLMSMTNSSMTGARRSTCSCGTFKDVSMFSFHGLGQTLRNSLMNALLRAGSPPPNVTPPPVA